MAGWAPFLAVVAVLTLAVLGLARQSQGIIREYGPDEEADDGHGDATEPDGFRDTDGGGESPRNDHAAASGPSDDAEQNEFDRGADDRLDDGIHDVRSTSRGVDAQVDGAGAPDGIEPGGSPHSGTQPSDGGSVEARPTAADPDVELTTAMLLANVAVTQGVVAALVLGAAWYFSIPADAFGVADTAASIGPPAVGLGAAFGVALWLGNELATAVADAVGATYDEAVRQMLAPDSVGGWAVLLGAVLPIIAVSEELLFRAALIGVPAAAFGVSPWLLAVVASVAFALGHGAQGRVGVVVTGALGFVLAAGYVVSGSLLLVIVAHYVINAMEFLVHERLGIEDVSIGRPPTPGA